MKFSSRTLGDVVVFDLTGALEGGEDSYRIKDAVKDELNKGSRKILLNMDKVSFVNSTGIGIITVRFCRFDFGSFPFLMFRFRHRFAFLGLHALCGCMTSYFFLTEIRGHLSLPTSPFP